VGEIAQEVIDGDRSQETGEIIDHHEIKAARNRRRAARRKRAKARKKET
jgi:hypothetical protein